MKNIRRKKQKFKSLLPVILILLLFLGALLWFASRINWEESEITITEDPYVVELEPSPETSFLPVVVVVDDEIPEYFGEPYVEVNGGVPYFTEDEFTTISYEYYAPLDDLGRCTEAEANIGLDLFAFEERGSISSVKPSGWQNNKYDFIDGQYLFNRCHLIAYMLTGENANEKNLITGTRYLNIMGMLPFESAVHDYIVTTNNHVLYRVTPVYTGDNLVADGVLMEAYSIEDHGEGIMFNIFAYNVQPGVVIDYSNGDNWIDEVYFESAWENSDSEEGITYALNTSSHKFHLSNCDSVSKISQKNLQYTKSPRIVLIANGYEPCGVCNP